MRKMTTTAREELVNALARRYVVGTCEEKTRILDELEAVTVFHRKHAMRVLRSGPTGRRAEGRAGDVEEQSSLRVAPEPVLPPEGVLLRDASAGEPLAREPSQQDVVFRNVLCGNLGDVPSDVVLAVEVGEVGFLAEAIPLRREHAPLRPSNSCRPDVSLLAMPSCSRS